MKRLDDAELAKLERRCITVQSNLPNLVYVITPGEKKLLLVDKTTGHSICFDGSKAKDLAEEIVQICEVFDYALNKKAKKCG